MSVTITVSGDPHTGWPRTRQQHPNDQSCTQSLTADYNDPTA